MSVIALEKEILPQNVFEICSRLQEAGARPIIVGGWVRDRLMGLPSDDTRDVDIEVFRLSFEKLRLLFQNEALGIYPKFGVLRLHQVDLSLPRLECCVGEKYNDFCVHVDPSLSFKKAGKRRDFTINAIGLDLFSKKILDPFGGVTDLRNKLLKPISDAFVEDSYRVLRAAQLMSRFDFSPGTQLLTFGKNMSCKSISQKHIQHTQSVLKAAPYRDKALQFLRNIQWSAIIEIMGY